MYTGNIIPFLGKKLRLSPIVPTGNDNIVVPGDLSKFAPYGSGAYGYRERSKDNNPFTDAPQQEACGGHIYFDSGVNWNDFEALLRLLGVERDRHDYTVFLKASEHPCKDGYIVQMRIVPKFAMQYLFGALRDADHDAFEPQGLSVSEALYEFIKYEQGRWGTSFHEERGLEGMFGGDGDCEREQLSFGFMMENEYYNIVRIWSRAWLVTK